MSTEMLEDICVVSESHPSINRRESRYKIRDHIKRRQLEWKGALKATQNMGNVLHKAFRTMVKENSQYLPTLGEYGSEFSYFVP